jgi:hypothetical protein
MLNSVQVILHPPELHGRDHRRYWIAVLGWFAIMLGLLVFLGSALLTVIWWLEQLAGTADLAPYESLILGAVIIIGMLSVLGGDRLWLRLFIQSGYLSDATTIRLMTNQAPTGRGERVHRWLGPLLLLAIYGTLSFAGYMARQWWVLFVSIPLLIWGLVLMRVAHKQADEILVSGDLPPDSKARIQQIEQILEDRQARPKSPSSD